MGAIDQYAPIGGLGMGQPFQQQPIGQFPINHPGSIAIPSLPLVAAEPSERADLYGSVPVKMTDTAFNQARDPSVVAGETEMSYSIKGGQSTHGADGAMTQG